MPKIALIAALSSNRAIGLRGVLPWKHLAPDWDHFKAVTAGHKLIMGRLSYESTDRLYSTAGNFVVTSKDITLDRGFEAVSSLKKAINLCSDQSLVFVIGGSRLFEEALPLVSEMYLTHIHQNFDADAFFPEIDYSPFELCQSQKYKMSDGYPYDFDINHYIRKT